MQIADENIKTITTSLATISLTTDHIMELRFTQDEYEVDAGHIREFKAAMEKLDPDPNQKSPLLVVSGLNGGVTYEKNLREFLNSAKHPVVAIVIHDLAQRLLGNFYFYFKKSENNFHYKLFKTEMEAKKWIANFKNVQ